MREWENDFFFTMQLDNLRMEADAGILAQCLPCVFSKMLKSKILAEQQTKKDADDCGKNKHVQQLFSRWYFFLDPRKKTKRHQSIPHITHHDAEEQWKRQEK